MSATSISSSAGVTGSVSCCVCAEGSGGSEPEGIDAGGCVGSWEGTEVVFSPVDGWLSTTVCVFKPLNDNEVQYCK